MALASSVLPLARPVLAEGESCPYPDPAAAFRTHMDAIDPLRTEYLRTATGTDQQSPHGALIADSCTGDETAKINAGLERALTQAERCFNVIGFGPIIDTVSVMRRARFECVDTPCANIRAGACNDLGHMEGDQFVPTNPDHHHSIVLSRQLLSGMTNPETIAATLFHEALHSTSCNNRDWHNDAPNAFANSSCSESVFRDRVYLLQGACFPHTHRGVELYAPRLHRRPEGGGPTPPPDPPRLDCPGMCEAALNEIDPQTSRLYPPRLAYRSLPPGVATTYCDRIRAAGTRRNELAGIIDRIRGYPNTALDLFPDTPGRLSSPIRKRALQILRNVAESFGTKRPFDYARIEREVDEGIQELNTSFGQTCSTRHTERTACEERADTGPECAALTGESWRTFCTTGRREVIRLLGEMKREAQEIDESARSIDLLVTPVPGATFAR